MSVSEIDLGLPMEKQHEEEYDATKDLYLSFKVDEEEYAIGVIQVKELVPICAITVVPDTPDFLKGIVNLRGDIVPVINVRTRFRKEEIPYDENTCIIVIYHEDYIMGLIVDQVVGVYTIMPEDIAPPPHAKLSYSNMFVRNIGKANDGLKLLLDLDKLLTQ
ncbi:MAG: chemotaxis protein CheW [Clostridiales bacterium]|jgi:purine-binding chemotaxis protein CheW|nr:chemotaxis protein CheW [Clostridiales bacterium]